jgi:sugar phosphate permease
MSVTEYEAVPQSRLIKRVPVYYGWIILIVGTVGVILTGPGQTYAISVFIDHFIDDLGISRSAVSSLYTVGTLAAALAMPLVGRLVDRHGPRLMMVLVSLAFGFACIYMGFVNSAVMLGAGFIALRMLGQGSLSLSSKNAINQWWVRRRGMAMGIAGMAAALLSSGGFPNVITGMIPIFGWRVSYGLLGLVLWVVMVPLSLIFIRNKPEEFGLQPDGMSIGDEDKDNTVAKNEPIEDNWTLSEALHTSAFWLIAAALAVMAALSTGLTFHIFSIFRDSGLNATVAASVFIPIAATSAVIQLGGGFLIDRTPVRVLLSTSLVLLSVSLIMAPSLRSVEMAFVYGLISGVRSGLMLIVHYVVWARYFGRRYLGSITGVVVTLLVGSSALGPLPFGIARDVLGSYTTVLASLATFPLVLAGFTLVMVKSPVRKSISIG